MEKGEIKKLIVEELKKEGVEIGEEVAMRAAKVLIALTPKILEATPNKFDDLLIPVVKILGPKLLEAIDKIDGETDL